MKTDFRNRAFLPVVIPLAILVSFGLVVGLFALVLLNLTRETAVVFGFVAAAGILVAVALATSKDRLDRPQMAAVVMAAFVPIVFAGLIAAGTLGNIADEDRLINIQPHQAGMLLGEVPADAPLLAATSIDSFCLPTGSGCENTREWDITWEDQQEFAYAFDNRQQGTEHNLVLYDAAEAYDGESISLASLAEDQLVSPELPDAFPGPETRAYGWETAENPVPEQFYFVCTIHPTTMYGLATISG